MNETTQSDDLERKSMDFTDKVTAQFNRAMKALGGVINPWLWTTIFVVILIGQSFAVKAFVIGMLALSVYFKWFHGENNILRKYANTRNNNSEIQ